MNVHPDGKDLKIESNDVLEENHTKTKKLQLKQLKKKKNSRARTIKNNSILVSAVKINYLFHL
jgi:hypothetical protein